MTVFIVHSVVVPLSAFLRLILLLHSSEPIAFLLFAEIIITIIMYLKEHSEIILLKSFNKDLLELGTGGAGINFMTFKSGERFLFI